MNALEKVYCFTKLTHAAVSFLGGPADHKSHRSVQLIAGPVNCFTILGKCKLHPCIPLTKASVHHVTLPTYLAPCPERGGSKKTRVGGGVGEGARKEQLRTHTGPR